MSIRPFWGCFAKFLESVHRFGRWKCHFLSLENWHFCQKCPFSSDKKWHFECSNLRANSKDLRNTPQYGLLDIWFMRLAFSGEYQANFSKSCFRRRFTLLKGQKIETGGQARKMPQKSFFLQKWVSYIQDQIILKGKVILIAF